MKVAVVGATGLVGTKMLQVLAERNFPVTTLIPVASEKSVGKEVEFKGNKYKVVSMTDAIAAKPAVAIFSAGGGTSLEWAPQFAAAGITVIDNSSAWRMDPSKPLVVPEINADLLKDFKIDKTGVMWFGGRISAVKGRLRKFYLADSPGKDDLILFFDSAEIILFGHK